MRFSKKKLVIRIVTIYKYLLTLLTAICLFAPHSTKPDPNFMGSQPVGVLVRFFLVFYFTFSYWSISASLINQINKTKSYFRGWYKNIVSLPLFVVSALMFGLFFYLLTKWSLMTFVRLQVETINFISLLNSSMYATLVIAHYFWLPEDG